MMSIAATVAWSVSALAVGLVVGFVAACFASEYPDVTIDQQDD